MVFNDDTHCICLAQDGTSGKMSRTCLPSGSINSKGTSWHAERPETPPTFFSRFPFPSPFFTCEESKVRNLFVTLGICPKTSRKPEVAGEEIGFGN